MDLQRQHMHDKNRMAKITTTIVCVANAFCTLLAAINLGFNFSVTTRLLLCVGTIITCQVAYFKIGYEEKFRYFVTLPLAATYIATLFLATSAQSFAIMFSIIIIVLIYGEAKTVNLGCAVAIGALLVADIINFSRGNLSSDEMVPQILFASIGCTAAIHSISQQMEAVAKQ